MIRRNFSSLTLEEAMELVPVQDVTRWMLNAPERPPSDILLAIFDRYDSFDLVSSEPAKLMLIDAVPGEVVPLYPKRKVWKGEPIEAATVGGIADYLTAPRRAYVKTPLLCAIEAKRDDFKGGEI